MWKSQRNKSRCQSLMELTFLGTRRQEWAPNDYKLSFSMCYIIVMFVRYLVKYVLFVLSVPK